MNKNPSSDRSDSSIAVADSTKFLWKLDPTSSIDGDNQASISERWSRVFNNESEDLFPARLTINFGSSDLANLTPADRWKSALNTVPSEPSPGCPQTCSPEPWRRGDLPFAPLWWPMVSAARQSLKTTNRWRTNTVDSLFARHLLRLICKVAALPTYQLFCEYRNAGKTFAEFLQITRESGFQNLFGRYGGLWRVLTILTEQWVRATDLFFARLEADEPELLRVGLLTPTASRISALKLGLSDRHHGGLQVVQIRFSDASRLIYKPKDMSLESVLPELTRWLNEKGFPEPLRLPKSLARDFYGWAEYVRPRHCRDAGELKMFYRRAGSLLCLTHVLNGRDILVDNLLAAGPDPVVIDLETFFHAEPLPAIQLGKANRGGLLLSSSVLDTGLLPVYVLSGLDSPHDLSGLSGTRQNLAEPPDIVWDHPNSDRMQPLEKTRRSPGSRNLPGPMDVRSFVQEIQDGFAATYRFLESVRDDLQSYLGAWGQKRTRVVYRATNIYARLREESLRPETLVSSLDRNLVFERLFRPALRLGEVPSALARLIQSEIKQLCLLDVPRFYAELQSNKLYGEDGLVVSPALREPPLQTVRRRLDQLDELDLEHQLELISESFRRFPGAGERAACPPGIFDGQGTKDRASETDAWITLPERFAHEILNRTNLRGDSLWPAPSCWWRELRNGNIERAALYQGDAGILIFLAAQSKGRLDGDLTLLLTEFLKRAGSFTSNPRLGIGQGIGSLVYSLLLLARLLQNRTLVDEARSLAAKAAASPFDGDRCRENDLLSGLAGWALALTWLASETKEEKWLAEARRALNCLNDRYGPDRAWSADEESPLGLAHGTAGIAMAALRYWSVSGDPFGWELANQAFTFERRFSISTLQHWPGKSTPDGWCSGLPGTLLTRALGWKTTGEDRLHRDLQTFIPELSTKLMPQDHWCCGNFGTTEVLLTLSDWLEDTALRKRAVQLTQHALRRGRQSAFYRFGATLGENYSTHLNLFRGLAGLGYTLLRIQRALPSIVAFEL